jgi:uncharacterized membrane protein
MSTRHHIHKPAHIGETIADSVAAGMGSWRFIIVQSAIVALWIGLNLTGVAFKWDPYPFILLNLLFSTQAAYAAPIIMMSQNRAAAKDRKRDDLEAQEVADILNNHQELLDIDRKLLVMQNQQMELLEMLKQPRKAR